MSLMFCPDCGSEVSNHAIKCPKCSYPINRLFKNDIALETTPKNESIIWVGYLMAFLSLLIFPFLFMLIGVIIGIVNITKKEVGHGIAQIILSIIFGIIGTFLGVLSVIL